MVSQRGQVFWSSFKLFIGIAFLYFTTRWILRGAEVPTVWTYTFHTRSVLHTWRVLTYEYYYLDGALYELQRALNTLHENAAVIWVLTAVVVWRCAIAVWRDWELLARGRIRTSSGQSQETPRTAQPLPHHSTAATVSDKPPALRQWSQSLHEDIFKGLEFTEQSVSARIRVLLSHFDRSDPFGRGVHTRIQQLVKEETGLDTLPASEQMSDGSRLVLDGLWCKIGEFLEEMIVKVDDDRTVLTNHLRGMKPKTRTAEDILSHVSNFKSLVRSRPGLLDDRRAIQILLQSLERQQQALFRQYALEDLTFEVVTKTLKQEFQYWMFLDKGNTSEAQKPSFTRPQRNNNAKGGTTLPTTPCPRCKKMGHWKVDCPLNRGNPSKRPFGVNEAVVDDNDGGEYRHLEEGMPSGEVANAVLATAAASTAQMRVKAYMPQLKQKDVEMLLDSGGSVNILPEALIPIEERIRIDRSRRMTLTGFDGSTQQSEGVFYTKIRLGSCRTFMTLWW